LQAEFRWVVTFVTHAWVAPSYVRAVPSESSRTTAAILVVAALVAVFAVVRLSGPSSQGGGGGPVRIDHPSATGPGHHGAMIYVHVAGAVRQPGLLRLPSGSRVATAVERAGGAGPRAELSGVNLAARLEDGQQVLVPVRGAAAGGGLAASAGASGPGAAGVPKASLGSATVAQLDEIDGIGPTLAQRIIEYRTEHGGFRSMGELREVEGIGEKRFETLRDALQP
jgi:competence protein ComEA